MKLAPRDIPRFLKTPDAEVRAALVYGPDRGLVNERVNALAGTVADADDPFSSVELAGKSIASDPARLADEVCALSLTSARRVVRLREATDGTTEAVKRAVTQDTVAAFLIVEAAELGPRSSLRRFFEGSKNSVAIACYADDATSLASLIRETLGAEGKTIEPDAESLLVSLLGADRAMSRMELEKLIIYCGDATSVTVDDIQAVITGSQVQSAGDAAFAVFSGDVSTASVMLDELIASGIQPISILRAAALHAMRLHLAVTWYTNGRTAREAMDNLKPKVFFRQAPTFQRQLESWTEPGLVRTLELLAEAEIDCKTTGLPATAVCVRTLLRIAQAASRQGRRAS